MKIYTKTGDQGETSLFGGGRVPKHHLRVEAYGTIDEVNSFLGVARGSRTEQAGRSMAGTGAEPAFLSRVRPGHAASSQDRLDHARSRRRPCLVGNYN